ncbi:hypothetical protein L3X38_002882 [Prunus dulcis]|uniref:Integrase catalytic domain-containing protein n=1 Tax=Prunus dulcis TaxID=3755 RepID=A0AAD4WVB6_PRUDU|nr:hypothetical protein L3X38_002882 [Prunus dulcis]
MGDNSIVGAVATTSANLCDSHNISEFCTVVSTQFQARVKVFWTDNGGEYLNNTLAYFFRAQGRPLVLDRSPISGDEANALGAETTGRTEASDQSPVSENGDSDSCMDELNAIPPFALPVP